MIPFPSTRVSATPVLGYPADRIHVQYDALDLAEQRRLLLVLAREHVARLDSRAVLQLLCDLADIVTPYGSSTFGDPPIEYREALGTVEGPVYLDLTLVEPPEGVPITRIEKPFTLSVLRNPPRYRTGSPLQPQLLITSFSMDLPTAISTYHRLADRVEALLERWGYAPPPRCACGG